MSDCISLGIVLPANNMGGPQKIAAITAIDLARSGHRVTIFLPVLPYYYYYVSLSKRPLSWLSAVRRHVMEWARNRKFVFQELLDESEVGDRISIKFLLRRVSKKQLKEIDWLVINSVAQVQEYQHLFPQERQIYLFWHPEEQAHGHAETFKMLRKSFKGKVLISSWFTGREVADHINNPLLLPAPIAPAIWERRSTVDADAERSDLLLSWKNSASGNQGSEIVKELLKTRPQTTVTIWCAGSGSRTEAQDVLPGIQIVENLSEEQLSKLYLTHSMLLFPSTYEGFGMPPIEALACGCIPVLHLNVGAAELYARDGENSLHLNGNPAEMAQRIADCLDDSTALRSMRTCAPNSIASFDPNGYGLRMLQAAGAI